MTNHRDPVEKWLSQDVDLLQPPQGAFRTVRRRARRRKAVQAMSAAAAAAVVVAAAVSLPQLAGNLLSGPTSPNRVATSEPGPATRSSAKATSQAPHPTATRHLPPLSSAGSGQRPPAGFSPTSVTFINGGSLGAVIGQGGASCGPAPCTLVAGTSDYGRRWTEIGAPPAAPPAGSSGVSQIRFADKRNGWAYGPALWATHDGGTKWRRVTTVPGPVIDLATVGRRVFAVAVTGCAGTGSQYAKGCTRFTLFRAPAAGGAWHQLAGGLGPIIAGALQLNSNYGYLLAGGTVYSGPIAGSWRTVPVPASSPVTPTCLTSTAGRGLIAPNPVSSPNSGMLYLVCDFAAGQRPALYASGDSGRAWQAKGTIPLPANATATSLAVSPGGPLVLATTAGIYYSGNASTWHRVAQGAFRFVGMTTNTDGVAVPQNAGLHEVFVTRDGGRHWRSSKISQ